MVSIQTLPLAFSTLACPSWDWHTILNRAYEYGYSGLELRGVKGQLDLTQCAEFAPDQLDLTLQELRDHQLQVVVLGASAKMHETDPTRLQQHLDEARRFVDLAQQLGAKYVRVFPDKFPPDQTRQATLDRITTGLSKLGEYAGMRDVGIVLETHGDVTDIDTLSHIMQVVNLPNVGIIWDVSHVYIAHGQPPADVYQALGEYIFHVHLKDCIPAENGVQYVLLGEGIVPIRETLEVLTKNSFGGYISFEWEKLWHPKIADPDIALPHFIKTLRAL